MKTLYSRVLAKRLKFFEFVLGLNQTQKLYQEMKIPKPYKDNFGYIFC